jgi:hypothetical protein
LLVTNRHVRHDHSGIAHRERATVEHSKVTPGGTATSRLASDIWPYFPAKSRLCSGRRLRDGWGPSSACGKGVEGALVIGDVGGSSLVGRFLCRLSVERLQCLPLSKRHTVCAAAETDPTQAAILLAPVGGSRGCCRPNPVVSRPPPGSFPQACVPPRLGTCAAARVKGMHAVQLLRMYRYKQRLSRQTHAGTSNQGAVNVRWLKLNQVVLPCYPAQPSPMKRILCVHLSRMHLVMRRLRARHGSKMCEKPQEQQPLCCPLVMTDGRCSPAVEQPEQPPRHCYCWLPANMFLRQQTQQISEVFWCVGAA